MTMPSFFLCLAGFVFLAVATRRVRDDLSFTQFSEVQIRGLRTIGFLLLAASAALAVRSSDWLVGSTRFIGQCHLCAGLVLLLLIFTRRLASHREHLSMRLLSHVKGMFKVARSR